MERCQKYVTINHKGVHKSRDDIYEDIYKIQRYSIPGLLGMCPTMRLHRLSSLKCVHTRTARAPRRNIPSTSLQIQSTDNDSTASHLRRLHAHTSTVQDKRSALF